MRRITVSAAPTPDSVEVACGVTARDRAVAACGKGSDEGHRRSTSNGSWLSSVRLFVKNLSKRALMALVC
ncbi:hypothetical protein Aglo01_13840 [Actinokineospora globicatena]|nr:hypothetical protein Aglo01_13840 [Actinokineospora globicatena]GLW83735.1 hypothetical protein Aglo02_13750 [Actinokineospora globicatena]